MDRADDANTFVRKTLADLVTRYGTGLLDDPRRVQALLRDTAGEHRAQVASIVAAAEEAVPEALLQSSQGLTADTAERLVRRLRDRRALTADAASWAVESWAAALGVYIPPVGAEPPRPVPAGTPPPPHPPEPAQPGTRPLSPRPPVAASPLRDVQTGQVGHDGVADPWLRLGSWLLDVAIFAVTLGIGWTIWALFTASEGQTPGKRLLNLRVVAIATAAPATLGRMFWLRGIVGWLVVWIAASFTLGIILFMPFWDRRNQNLWDKLSACVVVVDDPRPG